MSLTGSRGIVRSLAVLAVLSAALASRAAAQCPAGGICFFGTDVNGSSTTRATSVQSATARSQFLTNLVGVGTETFEGFAAGAGTPLNLTFPGAGAATLSGNGAVVAQGAGTNGFGRYPISGTKYFEATSAAGGGTTFSVLFGAPVAAFGFFGIDVGEFASQLSLRFTLVGGGTQTWALPYVATNGTDTPRDGSILYAGFINTSGFTRVDFLGTNTDDVFGFDDMTIGSQQQVVLATPEPGSIALLGTGLLGLAAFVRRRRRAA